MRSHSDGVRSDVYRIPMLIGESESLYNCKMHDLSSFSQRYHFLNRLLGIFNRPTPEVRHSRWEGLRPTGRMYEDHQSIETETRGGCCLHRFVGRGHGLLLSLNVTVTP